MRPRRFAFAHLLHPHLPPCGASSSSLTTTPFRRSSMRRFEARSCKPAPGGLLPSSVQHHELALVFVTHTTAYPSSSDAFRDRVSARGSSSNSGREGSSHPRWFPW